MDSWDQYRKKAVWILEHFDEVYEGVMESDLEYYRDNKECGEDEEEFILFLLQGVGLSEEQIEEEILIEEFGMTPEMAEEIMENYSNE